MKKILFCSFVALAQVFKLSSVEANGFKANLEYLYWNSIQSNMSYAFILSDLDTFSRQSTKNQATNWSSGLRLGIDYASPCFWNTRFSWTHLHNNVQGSTSGGIVVANQLLAPNLGFIIGGNGVGGPASSKWKLHFNMFDCDCGFALLDNCRYRFYSYIGIKGGRINQKQLIRYDNFLDTNSGNRVNATNDQVNNFGGLGPKAAFAGCIKMGRGINLVGNFAFASLFGRHKSSTTTGLSSAGVFSESNYTNNMNKLISTLQAFIGLEWCSYFCNCYTVALTVCYETQYFWNTWRTQNSTSQNFFITNAGFGDLMFHGLTARLLIGF